MATHFNIGPLIIRAIKQRYNKRLRDANELNKKKTETIQSLRATCRLLQESILESGNISPLNNLEENVQLVLMKDSKKIVRLTQMVKSLKNDLFQSETLIGEMKRDWKKLETNVHEKEKKIKLLQGTVTGQKVVHFFASFLYYHFANSFVFPYSDE